MTPLHRRPWSVAALALAVALCGTSAAQTTEPSRAEPSDTDLAKQTQNPVADLISVPFQWSIAGWGDQNVNQMPLQPFVNYNFGKGWYLTSTPILTADWEADSGNQWTVPVGMGAGRLVRLRDLLDDGIGNLGKLPINTSLQGYWNAVTPDFGPDWQLRFQVQFLFPR